MDNLWAILGYGGAALIIVAVIFAIVTDRGGRR
jgi:hypothetical protein